MYNQKNFEFFQQTPFCLFFLLLYKLKKIETKQEMLPKVVKVPEAQLNNDPSVTKGSRDVWVIPVELDRKRINIRSQYPNKINKIARFKQFPYYTKEKGHHACYHNLPIWYFNDTKSTEQKKYGHKRKGLGTLNGKIFDTQKIKDEIDLKRYCNWFGTVHTAKEDHRYQKLLSNENNMFDAAIAGRPTLINHCFTWPIRNSKGLLHKNSCQRVNVTAGTFCTFSFFPFSIDIVKKIERANNNSSWMVEFGIASRDEAERQGWITDPKKYDPTELDWYKYWYCGVGTGKHNAGIPQELKGNERLIPICHVICSKEDMYETTDGCQTGQEQYLTQLLDHIVDKKVERGNMDLQNPGADAFRLTRADIPKIVETLMEKENRYNLDRLNFRQNTSFKHFEVLGGPKEETVIPFGYPHTVRLLMECTK